MAAIQALTVELDDDTRPRPLFAVPADASTSDDDDGNELRSELRLYRLVGPTELELLDDLRWSVVPSRANWPVIFFKFLAYDDAVVALGQNPYRREIGIVEIPVDRHFAESLRVEIPNRLAGRTEYWIDADRLDDLNAHVVGPIRRIR